MARVTGPLMSFDASGSIAGAVVFSKWRGRNYVRRHAVPSNPRSTGQLAARSIISFLGPLWVTLSPADKATWLLAADAEKISAFNQFIKVNARNWRDLFAPSLAFPAARTETAGTVSLSTPVVSGRQIQMGATLTPGSDDWGVILCRSISTGFTATPANAVIVLPSDGFPDSFVDGPLDPGEYFYKAIVFSIDGKKSAASSQVTGTVV